jgi:hypothetical protein
MISRFVVWNERKLSIASPRDSGIALHEIISSSSEGMPNPQTLPLIKRLAVRQHLLETGTGAEVVLISIDGRPTLRLVSRVTIAEMELSVRSYNCFKAASIETLDELLSWTPSQLMELPNFGSKCLNEIIDIVHKLGYPSLGVQLVTADGQGNLALQPDGAQPAIQQNLADEGTGGESTPSVMDIRLISRPASRMTIADMELSVRAYNCLKAASIETLDELLSWQPSQLMDLPNFGRKCLNEITEIVHRLGFPHFGNEAADAETKGKLPLQEGSSPMACLLEVRELVPEGRLAELFIAHGWLSMADLAVHSVEGLVTLAGLATEEKLQLEQALSALRLELPIDLPSWFLDNTSALRAAFHVELEQLKLAITYRSDEGSFWKEPQLSRSLNEDIRLLIPRSYNGRNREIISDILGLGGKDPLTLDEVAKAQTPPLTRQRAHMIAQPITDALAERGGELRWLLKAIAALKRLAPCSLKDAERGLIDEKILDAPITVAAIMGLALRSNLEHNLILEGDSLLNTDTAELINAVLRTAGKLSSRWGVADWREIELLFPENEAASIKDQLRNVAWLDAEQRYCVLSDRENSLANRLARILTVTPRLKVAEAYRGAFRDVRMEQERLPETMFSAFCNIWPWCSVEGDEVVAKAELPLSEASGDDLLVLLIREIGHPIRRRELVKLAEEQGISRDTVTVALSYSNVITSRNGYFAVIGDPKLEEFEGGAATALIEALVPPKESEDNQLVPDENESDFPGLLMLAVGERVAALELIAPWSMSELRLSQHDRDRLLAWGQLAEWDFRDDFGNYETKGGEKVRKRSALGLAFLLFASEAVRRFGDSGSVWPAIERTLGERQQNLFMFRTGLPKPALREAVEAACRTFGLKHGFEDVGQQVWVRTMWLQSGLLCSHLPGLGTMLVEPTYLLPLAIQLLLVIDGPNASASFQASWKLLQDVSFGVVSEQTAMERLGADVWLSPFPLDELLVQCLTARDKRTCATSEPKVIAMEDAYQYFVAPVLRWESDEAYLEYSLNESAPQWRESVALVLLCEDPFRRERVPIESDRWQLPGGPVRVPITQRDEAGFRFKLMQGKEEVFAGWKHIGLPPVTSFTFFRASGAMVPSADDVPQGEEVVLLHSMAIHVKGLDAPPVFRVVLRGTCRLTRLPAGAVLRVRLLDSDGTTLWSFPVPEAAPAGEVIPLLTVRSGRWGTAVDVTLPELPFIAKRLRLNSGEVIQISRTNDRARLPESPGLGRAQIGRLLGSSGMCTRSARVKLHRLGADFGAALEMDGSWQPLDGSANLDAATLRTHRLLAKVQGPIGTDKEVCWMEGSRTLAGLRSIGTFLAGVHGLGECLNLVRGTYNSSEIEVAAAHAVMDGGFLRSVQIEADGRWSAHLPFEEPLEEGHSLWIWAEDSPLPRKLPRERMDKSGFTLRWSSPTEVPVFGWALSVDGARIGSIVRPDILRKLMKILMGIPWCEAAMWLRWWHVPVLHSEVRHIMAKQVREHPLETIKAWLLPAHPSSGMMFDELREEAWSAAAREYLWGWRPHPEQAVDLVKAMGIWTGVIEHDCQKPPSLEAVGLLARMSPILLADSITQALPELYRFPTPQLAVLLGMVLETINPNAVDSGFRLGELCERYAKAESRLDARFIMTSLIGAARALLRGEMQETHNLRLAFHQAGLRELISVALLRDVLDRWREGIEN